jgi:polyisoprenoid-binding protein YceI
VRRVFVTAAIFLSIAAPGWADRIELTFDTDRSTVSFILGATMHKVHGRFQLESGEVSYDSATGEAMGEVVVDARSGNSDNEKRDRDMHRKVLESENHPTIVLRPRRIDGELPTSGEGRLTLIGSLDIHGDEHEIEIPLAVVVDGDTIRVSAEFDVPYVTWGLKDPSKFVLRVAKNVTVIVEAEGTMAGRDF